MASETLSALVRKLEDAERTVDGLHAIRDQLEIEREQVEAMLAQERKSRVESETKRHALEAKLTELREQRVALSSRMSKLTADVDWLVDQQHKLQATKDNAELLAKCM